MDIPDDSRAASRLPRAVGASVLVAALLGAPPLVAQEEGVPVRVGEAELYPSLRVDYVRDTNAFLAPDDPRETDGVVVRPELEAVADRRLLELRAAYRGEFASYDEDALDFADHAVELGAVAELATRRRVSGELYYARRHERLGTNHTLGRGESFDEQVVFDFFGADGSFTYGAQGARGNVTGGLYVERVTYATLDEVTDGDDYTMIRPYGVFTYRLSPDTRALAELRFGRFTFGDADEDRNDVTAFLGIALAATGKTSGAVRIGNTFSDYAAEARDSDSTFVTEIDLAYLPRPYARLSLTLYRELDDLEGIPDAADLPQAIETRAQLNWNHEWSGRVSSLAFARATSVERGCPSRDTLTSSVGIELSIQLRRWLSIGFGGTTSAREASECDDAPDALDIDFEGQTYGAHVRATL